MCSAVAFLPSVGTYAQQLHTSHVLWTAGCRAHVVGEEDLALAAGGGRVGSGAGEHRGKCMLYFAVSGGRKHRFTLVAFVPRTLWSFRHIFLLLLAPMLHIGRW